MSINKEKYLRMRIIVTGHQGFIGSALMGMLGQHGHETFGMDIKSGMDIRDLGMVHRFFQKVCEGG